MSTTRSIHRREWTLGSWYRGVFGLGLVFIVGYPIRAQDDPLSPEERALIEASLQSTQATARRGEIDRVVARLLAPGAAVDHAVAFASLRSLDLKAEEALAVLPRLLEASDDDVREMALGELEKSGAAASSLADRVEELARDSGDVHVRARATATLARIAPTSPATATLLRNLLEAPDSPREVRIAAAKAVRWLGAAGATALPALAHALDGSSSELQAEAFRSIEAIRQAASAEAGSKGLPSAGTHTTNRPPVETVDLPAAFSILAAVRETPDLPEAAMRRSLQEILRSADRPGARAVALSELAELESGDAASVDLMLEAVADHDPFLARTAEDALAGLSSLDDSALPVLLEGLEAPAAASRFAAARALRRFGDRARPAAPVVIAQLQGEDADANFMRLGAYLDLLRAIGPALPPEIVESIVALLPETSSLYRNRTEVEAGYLRSYLLLILSEVAVPEAALSFVLDGLANSDDDMIHYYVASARAAAVFGEPAETFVPLLELALEPGFPDRPILFERFAQSFPGPESVYTNARLEAVRTLGSLGPRAAGALPALHRLAAEPVDPSSALPPIAPAAQAAIIRIEGPAQ